MAKRGRRIKSLDPLNAITPFIMPNRNGASNMFKATIDITEAERYLRQERLKGRKNMNMMHVFMASYVRVASQMPGINRFIRGQRVYAGKDIDIALTIKKEMKLDAQETVIQIVADPKDTLGDVYGKVNDLVEINKEAGDKNSTDKLARLLMHLPSLLLKFVVWFLKSMDYMGIMPRAITKASPFHGSMFITNVGSLGIDAIFHHLYDFGNIPIFISMGKRKNHVVVDEEGKITKRKVIDITIVTDERICDGHYYAEAFKRIKRLIANPWLLETPPEKVVEDIR